MSHSVRLCSSFESSHRLWLQQHYSHSDSDLKDKPKVNSMVTTPQMHERVHTCVNKCSETEKWNTSPQLSDGALYNRVAGVLTQTHVLTAVYIL